MRKDEPNQNIYVACRYGRTGAEIIKNDSIDANNSLKEAFK